MAHSEHSHSEHTGESRDVVQAGNVSGGIHISHGHSHGGGPGDPGGPPPRQLPGEPRGFVNRSEELGRLDAVLTAEGEERRSVCVIAGTAGAGKTSLALHWAHRVQEDFPDGQLYVNLRGYDPGEPVTAAQALHTFLIALGVPTSQ